MLNLHHAPATPAAGPAHTLAQAPPQRQRAVAKALLAGAFCLAGAAHDAAAMLVSLDTSTLSGTSARLEFVLFDGDFTANNSLTIASISTNGVLGAVDCSVDFGCTGGIFPPFAVDDAINNVPAFGQFLQDLTLGSSLSFELSFTSNYSGNGTPDPDRLVLSLLDPVTNLTLVDTDLDSTIAPVPFQDALLVVDLAGDTRIQVARSSVPNIPIRVPEPGAGALFSLGLALLGGQRIRRRRWFASSG